MSDLLFVFVSRVVVARGSVMDDDAMLVNGISVVKLCVVTNADVRIVMAVDVGWGCYQCW